MTSSTWQNIVIESQFATELALTGLRRLCAVPTEQGSMLWDNHDLNYALHVGMYSYSSGLERLCKLAIACNGFVVNGTFPNLKNYSHKIGSLLDAVEALPFAGVGPSSATRAQWRARPIDPQDPDLIKMVERFANGAGRYEHLDSLWKSDTKVNTYEEWSTLAANSTVSEDVKRLISLKSAVADVISSEMIHLELESTMSEVVEDLELPVFEPSVGLTLSLFRNIRWVSVVLDEATNQTNEALPILGEVVAPAFIHPSTSFFNFHIARFSDDQVIEEEVMAAYERIQSRDTDEEEEL